MNLGKGHSSRHFQVSDVTRADTSDQSTLTHTCMGVSHSVSFAAFLYFMCVCVLKLLALVDKIPKPECRGCSSQDEQKQSQNYKVRNKF